MAVGCLALGGTLFVTSFLEYQRYRSGELELARFDSVLHAVSKVSAERGPANSAMGASIDVRPQFKVALAEAREATDHAMIELNALGEVPGSARLAMLIANLKRQLARGRAAVDAVVEDPIVNSDGRAIMNAIEQMFVAADLASHLRNTLGQKMVESYPQISTEIILGTVCSDLREYAGRFGSYVVMMLTSPPGADERLLRNLSETRGQLVELRRLASTYTHAFAGLAPVEEGLANMDRAYFSDALLFARHVAKIAQATETSMTAAEFTRLYVPGMKSVEQLRAMIADVSLMRLQTSRENAGRMLVVSSLLTFAVCGLIAAINIVLNRMLFRPLMSGKEQIIAISKGDLSEPLIERRISKEIREMFEALAILRKHGRYKRILERNQEQMAEQLKMLSETDGLTGLLNRRALEDRAFDMLKACDGKNSELGVILFDIDHFKSINDTYGHGLGDRVLQSVGPTLKPLLDPQDAFARFGGEEFIVLFKDEEGTRATRLAEMLRSAFAQMADREKFDFPVTASFGVATGRPGVEDWETLVSRADHRLYEAKRQGRNRVCAG
ncbi:diguanylate cyclase [Rhizobiaceae bacterium n13]|uniref:diguanylate cyclase n=1 Tax=Ferirhizobium litorale TaxID=2927786 RepID=A0AAE3QBE5_9HYPH|nr:diguanylate cyclase [Fererhizobium litorale]MDI7861733.1 diguanylate cyclase [Fererhizobium litorale]MDI7921925.1 diguanylate cyclase [Fererhizobium litorale]